MPCLDVTDHDALSGAIVTALTDVDGRAPGILVNNAAVVATQALDELTLDDWQRRVINIASIAARVGGGLVGTTAYATPKGGLIASPAAVHARSPHVASRLGEPGDAAAAVCFLAPADGGWITGRTLDVNGGMFMT